MEYPSPVSAPNRIQPDRPWSLGEALLLWVLSVIFVLMIPILVAMPFIVASEQGGGGNVSENPSVVLASIAGILPAHLLTLAVAWWLVRRRSSGGFLDTLGWRWNQFGPMISILLTIGFLVLASVAATLFPPEDNDFLKLLRSSPDAIYFVSFVAIFTAPLVEEVVYRGVLFPALKKSHGTIFSVVSVTALFALVHVPQYWPSFTTIGIILSLSLFLTVVRNISDSLLPCFVIHLVFNSLQVVFLLMFPDQILGEDKPLPTIIGKLFT